jgi:hypothetical protein
MSGFDFRQGHLDANVAQEGLILTEAQVIALPPIRIRSSVNTDRGVVAREFIGAGCERDKTRRSAA